MTAATLASLVLFLDQPEIDDEDGLISGLARVATGDGPVMVPATRVDGVPHLAVTQCEPQLGYDVTHLPTGVTLVRHCASFGAALLALVQTHAIRVAYQLDLAPRDPVTVRAVFAEVDILPVPFADGTGHRPSVGDWLTDVRQRVELLQLPWESSAVLVREAMLLLEQCARLAPPAPAEDVPA
jgi:hypothetical protein